MSVIITDWDSLKTLALPDLLIAALIEHLMLPFQTGLKAKQYWDTQAIKLVVFEDYQEIELLEYSVELPLNYLIQLTICTEQGLYYLMPKQT